MNTSAIIVCAGNSSRMQGVNKILLPLGKTNVIGCTLTAFQKCESITDIVVVCRSQDEEDKTSRLCTGRQYPPAERYKRT